MQYRSNNIVVDIATYSTSPYGCIQMRAIFYFAMAALEGEESQRNRLVTIYYGVGQTKIISGRAAEYYKQTAATPWGVGGFHCCADNNVLTPALQFLCKGFGKKILCRARFHAGK
jgi:hypothetical protein